MALIPAVSLAQEVVESVPEARYFDLVVPVYDIDAPIGTIAIQATQDGRFRIEKSALLPIIERVTGTQRAALIAQRLEGVEVIDGPGAAQAGFTLRFDVQQVALYLELPIDSRETNELALSDPPRAPVATASRLESSEFSAYTNLAFAVQNDPSFGGRETRGTLQIQSAARYGGFVLENEMFLETGAGSRRTLSRSGTRLTRDFPQANIRASLGDLFTTSRGFLQSEDVLGISFYKNVELFNPFVAARPTGRQSFALDNSSDVDIYVNNQLIRQVRLSPGNYDLTNFTQVEGANDIRLETRNELGETQVLNFTSFFDSQLLLPGMEEWQVNAGFESTRFDRNINYDFDRPIVTAFYRRGISNTLTLGASFQYRDEQSLLGAELVTANSFGNISLDAAAAYTDDQIGAAIAFTLQPNLPGSLAKPGRRFDLFAELTSEGFGQNPFNGLGESARAGFRYTDLFSEGRLSFSLSGTYTIAENSRSDAIDLSASLGYRFDNGLIARVTPNYRKNLNGADEAAIRISLTKTFGPRSRARATYDTRDDRALLEYDYVSQFGGIGTVGANVVATRSNLEDGTITANGSYIGNRFEANVGYSQIVEGNQGFDRGRINAVVETSIGFADGRVAIGRPISDSFAIVDTHETLGDRQLVVDPGVNDRGDRARSGALGPALVQGLGSYSLSRLGYSVEDLPVGYDLGTGILEFYPPYRSGYSATVGSARNASVIGVLRVPDGTPLGLARGTIRSETDEDFEEQVVFTNRAGRFGLLGLAAGEEYIVTFPELEDDIVIRIPADATGMVDIGNITRSER